MPEFDFATWTPNTRATLASVPWGSDYRDVVMFDDDKGLDRWINGLSTHTTTFASLTYARVGEPVRIPLPFNMAYQYNYLRVQNAAQTGAGEWETKSFYYFIQDVRHIAPNTTELIIQLDVFASFSHNVTFGNCFLERGHVGIAHTDSFANYGRDYLTVPEGLDVGGEYQIDRVYRNSYGETNLWDRPVPEDEVSIVVHSTTDLTTNPGTMENPLLNTSDGSTVGGLPNGASMYGFKGLDDFEKYLQSRSNAPWVLQGIIAVMLIPSGVIDFTRAQETTIENTNPARHIYRFPFRTAGEMTKDVTLAQNFRDEVSAVRLAGTRYSRLKKFLTYPYTVVEVTTYSGAPLILKPECVNDKDLRFVQFNHVTLPSPRIFFTPKNYNLGKAPALGVDDGGEFLDMQTGFYNLPQFSVVNNGYMQTMASQAHTIAYQHSAADWAQQRVMAGNQMAYNQATSAIGTNSANTYAGIANARAMGSLGSSTAIQKAGVAGLSDFTTSSIGGAAVGGFAGAGVGAITGTYNAALRGVNTAIDINAGNQATALSNSLSAQQMGNNNTHAALVRDTNKDYADWAAKGDYSNTIASINAKVQDARMTQPTTAGQVGGEAAVLSTHRWELVGKTKMVQGSVMNAIGEYWLRYGYQMNRFMRMPKSLRVMKKFTYWRVQELYLTADSRVPEFARQAMRGIFEKGVTVWSNPNDIGMVDIADNEPIEGDYLV